jgi:hypothetical protein
MTVGQTFIDFALRPRLEAALTGAEAPVQKSFPAEERGPAATPMTIINTPFLHP